MSSNDRRNPACRTTMRTGNESIDLERDDPSELSNYIVRLSAHVRRRRWSFHLRRSTPCFLSFLDLCLDRCALVPLASLFFLAVSSRGYFEKRDGIIKQQLDPWILFRRASNHHTSMPGPIFTLRRPRTTPAGFLSFFPTLSRGSLLDRAILVSLVNLLSVYTNELSGEIRNAVYSLSFERERENAEHTLQGNKRCFRTGELGLQ